VSEQHHRVYIGLGSNLGDRQANITKALSIIGRQIEIEQVSSYYETLPAYVHDQPNFFNVVAGGNTILAPQALLDFLKATEQSMGRLPGERYGPRLIDLDILFYDGLVMQTPALTIPHARLAERRFVLVPLNELSPNLVHPVYQTTVSELLGRAPDTFGDVIRIIQK
jgi:2-amino-4-hydroxy-6-hydroxymethyldihydropteridine diphosphokinase